MAPEGGCSIRQMRSVDIDRVVELENEIFPSPWTGELFRHELRDPEQACYLVAEEGGALTGYIGAQLLDAEVHVTNMAVAPGARRQGLGSALLLECIRRGMARGARWLTLEVRVGNEEARAFYRKFGFGELGIRRSYYADSGEDAVIMATGDIRTDGFAALLAEIKASIEGKGDSACSSSE